MDIPKSLLLDQFMWGDTITIYPMTTSTFVSFIHHAPFSYKSKEPGSHPPQTEKKLVFRMKTQARYRTRRNGYNLGGSC